MRNLILTTILAVMSFQVAQADIMSAGQKSFHAEYSQGTSTEVYTGDGTKVAYKDVGPLGGISKRDITNLALTHSFGLGSSSQIDLGLIYSQVDIGVDKRGGIEEVSAKYLYQAFANEAFDVNIGLGFRAPADNRGGADFNSLSDGLTKFDYSLDLGWNLNPFKVGLNTRYTDRNSSEAKSQTLVELYGAYFPTSDILLSLSYITFNTSGGGDVLAAPFQVLKEKYNAVSFVAGYSINDAFSVDAHYGQKLSSGIANTDANTTVGLGLTANY